MSDPRDTIQSPPIDRDEEATSGKRDEIPPPRPSMDDQLQAIVSKLESHDTWQQGVDAKLTNIANRLGQGDLLFRDNDQYIGLLLNSLRAILDDKGLTEQARRLDPEIERLGRRGSNGNGNGNGDGDMHDAPTSPSNPRPDYDAE